MASVKVKFLDKKELKDGTSPIAIQVIYNRKKKLFHLGHSLKKSEWDEENNRPNSKNTKYKLYRKRIERAINDLETIILELENEKKPFTLKDIEAKYKPNSSHFSSKATFNTYVDKIVSDLEEEKR